MSDLRAELAESVDEAEWQWLIAHVERDAVLLIDRELNLLDAGEAIANDNVSVVQNWINQKLLSKPTLTQIEEWNGKETKRFQALILQPYVLVQEIA